jgi:valyl-tRNA synthetase
LANPQFVEKAPVEVLEKSRAKLAESEVALIKLDEAIARLAPVPAT